MFVLPSSLGGGAFGAIWGIRPRFRTFGGCHVYLCVRPAGGLTAFALVLLFPAAEEVADAIERVLTVATATAEDGVADVLEQGALQVKFELLGRAREGYGESTGQRLTDFASADRVGNEFRGDV